LDGWFIALDGCYVVLLASCLSGWLEVWLFSWLTGLLDCELAGLLIVRLVSWIDG
jgi:hypothetical protein